MDEVQFFSSSSNFRAWLEAHHGNAPELWVGYHKKASGTPSITYPESVDQALCFGWIDGVRRSVDASRYTVRFTPRKPKSIWSTINTKRLQELIMLGVVTPTGLQVFQARDPKRSSLYSLEVASPRMLDDAYEKELKANKKACEFWQRQPPGYQRLASGWVMSAKREETRLRRLRMLIADSEKEKRLDLLSPFGSSGQALHPSPRNKPVSEK
jgi:uncharacterized protein YdeI (YjbR/CyaY-like superfamily)